MHFSPDSSADDMSEVGPIAHAVFTIYLRHRVSDPKNPDFNRAWPSRKLIAEKTGLNFHYISKMRLKLVEAGWLTLVDHTKHGHPIYEITKGSDELASKASPNHRPATERRRPSSTRRSRAITPARAPARRKVAQESLFPESPETPSVGVDVVNRVDVVDPLSDAEGVDQTHGGGSPNAQGGVDVVQPLYRKNQIHVNHTNEPTTTQPSSEEGVVSGSSGQEMPRSRHSFETVARYCWAHSLVKGGTIKNPPLVADLRFNDGTIDLQIDFWLEVTGKAPSAESKRPVGCALCDPSTPGWVYVAEQRAVKPCVCRSGPPKEAARPRSTFALESGVAT